MISGFAAAVMICVSLAAHAAAPLPQAPSSAPEVSLDQGKLTLKSNGATLRTLLSALAQQAQLTFYLPRSVAEREVELSLDDTPLYEGLRRLLEHTSYVLLHDNGGTDAGEPARRVIGIRVLSTGGYETISPGHPANADNPAGVVGVGGGSEAPAGSAASEEDRSGALAGDSGPGADLTTSLRDPNPEVRADALRSLRKAEAFPEGLVKEVALNDEVPNNRVSALRLLYDRGTPEATEDVLTHASEADPSKRVRKRAGKMLRRMQRKR